MPFLRSRENNLVKWCDPAEPPSDTECDEERVKLLHAGLSHTFCLAVSLKFMKLSGGEARAFHVDMKAYSPGGITHASHVSLPPECCSPREPVGGAWHVSQRQSAGADQTTRHDVRAMPHSHLHHSPGICCCGPSPSTSVVCSNLQI
ncbi:hypothetical protein P4O66_020390 [Electrophorus voltai]|uniref:Uncharacterized protein n=1 Tax=Electrophorus voltai TaxID=2609070 RepID=A0AAD8ZSH3_9TELE|nr:hypothetical protein P4O66_020390 [Electrophorus voltai]